MTNEKSKGARTKQRRPERDTSTNGLRKLRKINNEEGPRELCPNCNCKRYTTCTCSRRRN